MAANFLVPAMGLDFAKVHRTEAARQPMTQAARQPMTQHVDRTHKGDRLDFKRSVIVPRLTAPSKPLHGCEPAVSPLASTANTAGRCIT
jgi:hypothetical protein